MNVFNENLYLTDGGLETTLLFEKNVELRHFAAFELLGNEEGQSLLRDYFSPYLDIADKNKLPFVFETPTWRLNPDWAYRLGYDIREMYALNMESIEAVRKIDRELNKHGRIISGCIGPRGDGYVSGQQMSATESGKYHLEQIRAFANADADVVTAMTMTYSQEAIGIVRAAKEFNLPVVISYTLETDGLLPSGETLENAILQTDEATSGYAIHYMINCAHPTHFMHLFEETADWQKRIRGIRANASCKSHEELDNSTELDKGNPLELGLEYRELVQRLPWLQVLGGCCGTDHTHLESISEQYSEPSLQQDGTGSL